MTEGSADEIARERIAALDRLLLSEIARMDAAFAAFSASVAERFVAGNEFRSSLNDVQQAMATRRELEAFQAEYRNAHSDLLQTVADFRTTLAVGPAELRQLVNKGAESQGRREGYQYLTGQLLSFVAVLIAAAGLIGYYLH